MGFAIRGEPTASDFNMRMKEASLEIATDIKVKGGPRNRFEEALVELAEKAGNSPQEIQEKVNAATPKLVKI